MRCYVVATSSPIHLYRMNKEWANANNQSTTDVFIHSINASGRSASTWHRTLILLSITKRPLFCGWWPAMLSNAICFVCVCVRWARACELRVKQQYWVGTHRRRWGQRPLPMLSKTGSRFYRSLIWLNRFVLIKFSPRYWSDFCRNVADGTGFSWPLKLESISTNKSTMLQPCT